MDTTNSEECSENVLKIQENNEIGVTDNEINITNEKVDHKEGDAIHPTNPPEVKEIIEKHIIEEVNNEEIKSHEEAMEEEIMEKVIIKKEEECIASTSSKVQQAVSHIGLGLNMISQYDSDAEDTDKEQKPDIDDPTIPYRNQVVDVDSDTDSDSSSDDSTCSENTEGNFTLKRAKKALDKMLSDCSDDDDDDNKSPQKRSQPKVKGELLLDDLPPIEDLHITVPEDECVELGKVHSIVDQLALVSALPNSLLVDLDTVLFLNKGKQVLGAVFDVLGQVSEPLYCIRFNSNEQIKEKNINVGDVVYVAPKTEYTQFIILSNLLKVRGSDASWENDVEPPPRFLDYSDDEEERKARARSRNKDRRPESENSIQQKRTAEENMNDDTDSNASYNTRPNNQATNYRRNNSRGGGSFRGRGGGAYNPGYPMPHAGSWHSNYFQGPPPPPMFYGQHSQGPMMPYGGHLHNMPHTTYPLRFTYNTLPAPPGTQNYENNSNNM